MSNPQVSQLAEIAVGSGSGPPQLSQLAIIAVSDPPSTPVQMSQLAVISVVMNNERIVSLEDVIGLECWSPCTSYGTNSTIVYLGA